MAGVPRPAKTCSVPVSHPSETDPLPPLVWILSSFSTLELLQPNTHCGLSHPALSAEARSLVQGAGLC